MNRDQPHASNSVRYLAFAGITCVIIASIASCVVIQRQRVRQEIAENAAERRVEVFTKVKSGEDSALILDPLLIPMLANDADCVANLTEMRFDMIDIPPTLAYDIRRLENVSTIGFYDARGADHVIKNSYELPIKTLYFSVTPVSDTTLKRISEFPRLVRLRFDQNLPPSQLAILESFPEHVSVHTVQDLPNRKQTTANHPRQSSGEVGRFEVDDQPSPRADQ